MGGALEHDQAGAADAVAQRLGDVEPHHLIAPTASWPTFWPGRPPSSWSGPADGADAADRARIAIRSALHGGVPGVAEVARRLQTSERTLQRRLAEQGTSFQRLVDEVRADMARRYLRHTAVELVEVSYLLGFTHPNSFFRAFKRWTGRTPESYRRRARGRP